MIRSHMTLRTLVPVLALSALLAGCGSKDKATEPVGRNGGGTQAAAGTDFDKRVKFAHCMRDNGVDMKDPEPQTAGGSGESLQISDPAKFQAGLAKCRSLLPGGGSTQVSTEEMQRRRDFAKCMRDNGDAAYPDPDPNEPAAAAQTVTPEFTKADKICEAKVNKSGTK